MDEDKTVIHVGEQPEKLKEIKEKHPSLKKLSPQVYRSDRTKTLANMRDEGFEHLAWTPNVRFLLYNPKEDLMLEDIEGDLVIWENPSDETIEEEVQEFPKAEVSVGEKYDSRFERQKKKLDKEV